MIAEPMHRLADRLGMRDGQAYTVVCGLAVALFLLAVGMPGVVRGVDPAALAEIAAAPGAGSSSGPAPGPPAAEPSPAAALPALAPAAAPTPATSRTTGGAVAPPGRAAPTTVAPPAASDPGRAPGDVTVLAEVPEAGAPDGVAVAPDGTVYVVSDDAGRPASTMWAFSSTGTPAGTWTAAGQPVDRSRGLTGVAVGADGTVWATDASTARLLRLDEAAGSLVAVAEATDLPACGLLQLRTPCERGLVDSAPLLTGLAVGPDGTVVVADRGQGALWTLTGGELAVLTVLDDRLAGDGPVAVSFASEDELVVVTGARGSSFPPGLPAVSLIRLSDGSADAPVLITDLGVGEAPADVVVGTSGRVYVSIPSTGTIADIGIDQGDRIDIRPAGDPTSTAPTGLALRSRSLLVSDPSDRVFDLAVDDHPVTRGTT